MGSLSLLQGMFPTQGIELRSLALQADSLPAEHEGSPRILEWDAYPFSRGIFLTQELNQSLLHCRRILYQLSYEGGLIEYFYHGKYQINVIK